VEGSQKTSHDAHAAKSLEHVASSNWTAKFPRNSWLKEIQMPLNLISTCLTPHIESQTRIGWDQFILGRWSSKWQQFQQQYISTQPFDPTNTNHGIGWASNLICLIWEKCQDEWHTRNEARHGQDDAAQQQICLATAQRQIRALYELKDSCFYHGRTTYLKTSHPGSPSPELDYNVRTHD
jgi:hypothetical protein